jgi:hypothetical protein
MDQGHDSSDNSDDHPPDSTPAPVSRQSLPARKATELLRVIDELNRLHNSDGVKPTKEGPLEPFKETVLEIHQFFERKFDLPVILQAIHACAGDYRAAVVRLAKGFEGCELLSMPPIGEISKEGLRRYLAA